MAKEGECVYTWLLTPPLCKQKFHIAFERADLSNDTKFFDEVCLDKEKFVFCKTHAECTVFEWKNWENYLQKQET